MDEKYTPEYIAREAALIIQFFSPHQKKKNFSIRFFAYTEMDHRIMKKLGIK